MRYPDACPVVRVKCPKNVGNPHGFREINESDFDPETHERFGDDIEVAEAPEGVATPVAEPPKADVVEPVVEPTKVANDGWGAPKA